VIEAMLCQLVEPPVTTGLVGAVRSMRAVAAGTGTLGDQFEVLPTLSTARKRTRVSPSAVTAAELPDVGDDQLVPPSVEVWYSK